METREPRAMEEIHEIRLKLFEKEKKMGSQGEIASANKIAEDFVKKYHLENRIAKNLIGSS